MNKLSIITLVAGLSLAPTLSYAANVGVSGGVSAAASDALDNTTVNAGANGTANAGANGSANAGGSANFGTLISGLNSKTKNTATITSIGTVTSSSTINLIPISSLKASGNANAQALANAEAKAGDRLTNLRAAVHANAAIEAALTAKGYSDSQVVAVQVDAHSNVWVYVDDSTK